MIIGIDPGITNCGITLLENRDGVAVVLYNKTVKGTHKIKEPYLETLDRFGERAAKVERICTHLQELIDLHGDKITHIAIESPYSGKKSPNAYGALLEVLLVVRERILVPNPFIEWVTMAPATAKKHFAGHGGAKKPQMTTALENKIKDGSVILEIDLDPQSLNEHEIDSIGISFTVLIAKEFEHVRIKQANRLVKKP